MFPYWEDVIAPLIDSVQARRVVEIGALRGDTTVRMLRRLGADVELHVIDPVPQFDPAEHERAFPGRYVFHHGISHDILPTLAPCDVALVDGDHNWFTVYHELKMLAATARDAGLPLPLLIMHDVGWPYGRRDLYYEPERIPAEFRQPHRRSGMRLGISQLRSGGMNVDLDNAEHEGGPRNGVLTAVEDFVAQHDHPARLVVLPPYFGLAILAEEDLIASHPALEAMLDRFEHRDGQRELVELGERIRLEEVRFNQAWIRHFQTRIDRSASRYLDVVKAALLDEHYLENEARIDHLGRLLGAEDPDLAPLRDPARLLRPHYERIRHARIAGRSLDGRRNIAYFPYTDMGRAQLEHLEAALDRVRVDEVPGDLAEIGVGRGGGSIFLRAHLAAHEIENRSVWVVDRFLATTAGDEEPNDLSTALGRFGADLHQVRDGFARFGLLDDSVRFLQGPPAEVLRNAPIERLAAVRFGARLGEALGPALDAVRPLLAPGAEVIVSGTGTEAVETALADARERLGIRTPLERIDWNSMAFRMPLLADAAQSTMENEGSPGGLHLEPERDPDTETVSLSVVVVFYNMSREARRTLLSLSRGYQREVEDLDYEVIVVDNGSSPDQRLTVDEVRSYGPEFHLLDMGTEADPSPIRALNAGIALARGTNLALMIDGAHVLTPGVLHHGMVALEAYRPAVVATQQWYVGPGQQDEMVREGYDGAVEDALFERIQWPVDGYRLFEISHFIGERDWFDGIIESNCVFVSRKLIEQVGGFDERFSMPGGGYANLDLFERLTLAPGVSAASILGEGSFHQFHGGTTTNVVDEVQHRERIASYGEHFAELRGRRLLGTDRPIKYVGALAPSAAKRTRARRSFAAQIDALRDPVNHNADVAAVPVAEELRLAAIEATWDRKAWKEATWLGHRVNRYPADLHSYQELLARQRPDVVILTGEDDGLDGRARFVAGVLDQLGHGRIVAVGPDDLPVARDHERVVHVPGRADDGDVAAGVRAEVGAGSTCMVFLALGADRRVMAAFEQYADLVPPGGYVVVENTVVNGRPAAAGFGAGPLEGVFQLIAKHPEFVIDHTLEQYTITFNRNGFLRRLEDA